MNGNDILKNEEEITEEKLNILEEYISDLQSEKTSDVFQKAGDDAELISLMKTARDLKVAHTSAAAEETIRIKAQRDAMNAAHDANYENYNGVDIETVEREKTGKWKWLGFGLVFTGVGVAVLGFIFLTGNIINPDGKTGTVAEKNINTQNNNAVIANDNQNDNMNKEDEDMEEENDSQVANANTNTEINENTNANDLNNGIAETPTDEPVLAVGGADAEEMSVTAAAVGITDPQEYAQYEKDMSEDISDAETTEQSWNSAIEDTSFTGLVQDLESFDF